MRSNAPRFPTDLDKTIYGAPLGPVPAIVLDNLLDTFDTASAQFIVRELLNDQEHNQQQPRDELLHMSADGNVLDSVDGSARLISVSDSYGKVLAWLWSSDPDRAIHSIAAVLHGARTYVVGHETIDPPVTLSELLRGITLALPPGFTDGEKLLERARQEVPRLIDTGTP